MQHNCNKSESRMSPPVLQATPPPAQSKKSAQCRPAVELGTRREARLREGTRGSHAVQERDQLPEGACRWSEHPEMLSSVWAGSDGSLGSSNTIHPPPGCSSSAGPCGWTQPPALWRSLHGPPEAGLVTRSTERSSTSGESPSHEPPVLEFPAVQCQRSVSTKDDYYQVIPLDLDQHLKTRCALKSFFSEMTHCKDMFTFETS